MSKLEQRIFFKLLERYSQRKEWEMTMPNGLLCMLPNLDYDVVLKKSTVMRKLAQAAPPIENSKESK